MQRFLSRLSPFWVSSSTHTLSLGVPSRLERRTHPIQEIDLMKDIVDLCKAKVIWAKGSAFILLRLCRNSRELCGVSETNLKEGDFPLCPSRSCELNSMG